MTFIAVLLVGILVLINIAISFYLVRKINNGFVVESLEPVEEVEDNSNTEES